MKDLKIQVNWADFEVYPNCSELEDLIYDEANPNTSGLKKYLIYNEENPNLFVLSSPESSEHMCRRLLFFHATKVPIKVQ